MTIYRNNSSLQYRLLVMYMISALLFLISTPLHIHSEEAAVTAEHGAAVSVSSLVKDVIQADTQNQININPDGLLKANPAGFTIPVIPLLLALLVFGIPRICSRCRFPRSQRISPDTPDYGMPLLRAPPK
ncbi:MAG: hypothetical protein SV201_06430 [Pseudomonadota bacterium]|nr:hypothetical protein [Pseudomonadota bacterium]